MCIKLYAFFKFQPSVAVKLVNPQPMSGLFEIKLPIYEGDDKTKVLTRIMKTDRSKMKGTSWSHFISLSLLSLLSLFLTFKLAIF